MAYIFKQIKYQGVYLVWPVIAYSFYILLIGLALIKQRSGIGHINFMFLSFWGVLTFVISLLISSLGLIHRKKWQPVLLAINIGASLALIILSLAVIVLIHKTKLSEYSCNDFVRCLMR